MNDKITIKIEQTHDCGQVIEQIWHTDEADFTIKQDYPPLLNAYSQGSTFRVPELPKRKIAFEGTCSTLEINGIEWKGNRMLCQKCGADMLFPDHDREQENYDQDQSSEDHPALSS